MKTFRSGSVLIYLASVCFLASNVHAIPIGLINTGTDASGAVLPDGSVQPSWTITAVDPSNPPGGLTPPTPPSNAYVVPAYPVAWLANNAVSKWISYSTPLYSGGDIYREFTYSLTFQAKPGDDFFIRMAGDNGTIAYLNQTTSSGQLLDWGSKDGNNFSGFGSWSPWIDLSGLNNGDNTLTFVVYNVASSIDNPTGLRVEFSTAQPEIAPVPDKPSMLVTCSLSVVPVGLQGYRVLRNRKRVA